MDEKENEKKMPWEERIGMPVKQLTTFRRLRRWGQCLCSGAIAPPNTRTGTRVQDQGSRLTKTTGQG